MDDLWATKSEDVELTVHAISLVSKLFTDGQTDDTRSQDRALHYSASRGKNDITLIAGNNSVENEPILVLLGKQNPK